MDENEEQISEDYFEFEDEQTENKLLQKKWIKLLDNGNYLVKTKEGIFELQDIEYDVVNKSRLRVKNNPELGVLSSMIIRKNGKSISIGEIELRKYKSNTITRMLTVVNEIVGVSDFLSEDEIRN